MHQKISEKHPYNTDIHTVVSLPLSYCATLQWLLLLMLFTDITSLSRSEESGGLLLSRLKHMFGT